MEGSICDLPNFVRIKKKYKVGVHSEQRILGVRCPYMKNVVLEGKHSYSALCTSSRNCYEIAFLIYSSL